MVTVSKSRRRRRKKIVRNGDGSLYDATERRRITPTELRDYIRDGGLFEARREENGSDCTYEVLQTVMGVGFLQGLVPGMGAGQLSGFGGLSGLPGGAALGLLGGGGTLADLARLVGSGASGDRLDEWDDRPRRSSRRSDDRGWRDGDWSEPSGRSPRRDEPDWASDAEFD